MSKYRVAFTYVVTRPTNTTNFDIEYVSVDEEWTFAQSVDPFEYIREHYNVVGGVSVTKEYDHKNSNYT